MKPWFQARRATSPRRRGRMGHRFAWCGLCLAAWSSPAWAARYSKTDAAATLEELRPLVEREAGRELELMPTVEFADGELLDDLLRYEFSRRLMATGMSEEQATVEAAKWESPAEGALALYIRRSDTIFVKWQTIQDALEQARIAPDMLMPLMRCTLAHELTHALQDQVLGDSDDAVADSREAVLTERVMWEGHAALIQARVCADGEARSANTLMDYMQGIDVLPNRMADSTGDLLELVAYYGAGRVWLAGVEREGGSDAVWQALAHPPRPEEIGDAVSKMVEPAWTDAAFLVEPIEARVAFANLVIEQRSASPMEIVPILQATPISVSFAPRAHAGLAVVLDGGSRAVMAIAWEMASEAEATELIEQRADLIVRANSNGRVAPHLEPSTRVDSYYRRQVVRRFDEGERHSLWIKYLRYSDLPVFEAWLAEGPLVVSVVVDGVTLSRGQLMDLLADIADGAPDGAGSFSDLVGGGVAGGSRLSPSDPRALFHRAEQLRRLGDTTGCMDAAEAAVAAGGELDLRRAVSGVGYGCAIDVGDPPTMRYWGDIAASQGSVEPRLSIAHAASLADLERHREALAVLDRAVEDATDEQSRKMLMVARDRGYNPLEQQHYRSRPFWTQVRGEGVIRRGHATTGGAAVWLDYAFRPKVQLGLALAGTLPAALEVRSTDRPHPLVTGGVLFGFWLHAGSRRMWRLGAVVGAEGRDYRPSETKPFLVPTLRADLGGSFRLSDWVSVELFAGPTYDFRLVDVHYDGRTVERMPEASFSAGLGLSLYPRGGARDGR